MAAEHRLTIRRHQRGMTVIAPGRPVYGCTATCSACTWTGRSNYAPSMGGTRDLRQLHEAETGHRAVI